MHIIKLNESQTTVVKRVSPPKSKQTCDNKWTEWTSGTTSISLFYRFRLFVRDIFSEEMTKLLPIMQLTNFWAILRYTVQYRVSQKNCKHYNLHKSTAISIAMPVQLMMLLGFENTCEFSFTLCGYSNYNYQKNGRPLEINLQGV